MTREAVDFAADIVQRLGTRNIGILEWYKQHMTGRGNGGVLLNA